MIGMALPVRIQSAGVLNSPATIMMTGSFGGWHLRTSRRQVDVFTAVFESACVCGDVDLDQLPAGLLCVAQARQVGGIDLSGSGPAVNAPQAVCTLG